MENLDEPIYGKNQNLQGFTDSNMCINCTACCDYIEAVDIWCSSYTYMPADNTCLYRRVTVTTKTAVTSKALLMVLYQFCKRNEPCH